MRTLRIVALAVLALAVLASAGPAGAQEFAPAVVFDMGGKFDKSFNEAAFAGAERFKKETGIAYREFEVTNEAQREQALRNMARRGSQIAVGIGFAQATGMEKVAKEFPNLKFAIIDAVVDAPNVQSIVFKEHEGSFLVGMAAAMASKTGKVGFVGGMDIPLIRKLRPRLRGGGEAREPEDRDLPEHDRDDPGGLERSDARAASSRGASSTAAPTSSTRRPARRASACSRRRRTRDAWPSASTRTRTTSIPGTILTSMIKRVDLAVYEAFKTAKDGTWKAGVRNLGVKEGGVGYSIDEHNRKLITPEMEKRIEQARADIVAGKIKVTDYMAK